MKLINISKIKESLGDIREAIKEGATNFLASSKVANFLSALENYEYDVDRNNNRVKNNDVKPVYYNFFDDEDFDNNKPIAEDEQSHISSDDLMHDNVEDNIISDFDSDYQSDEFDLPFYDNNSADKNNDGEDKFYYTVLDTINGRGYKNYSIDEEVIKSMLSVDDDMAFSIMKRLKKEKIVDEFGNVELKKRKNKLVINFLNQMSALENDSELFNFVCNEFGENHPDFTENFKKFKSTIGNFIPGYKIEKIDFNFDEFYKNFYSLIDDNITIVVFSKEYGDINAFVKWCNENNIIEKFNKSKNQDAAVEEVHLSQNELDDNTKKLFIDILSQIEYLESDAGKLEKLANYFMYLGIFDDLTFKNLITYVKEKIIEIMKRNGVDINLINKNFNLDKFTKNIHRLKLILLDDVSIETLYKWLDYTNNKVLSCYAKYIVIRNCIKNYIFSFGDNDFFEKNPEYSTLFDSLSPNNLRDDSENNHFEIYNLFNNGTNLAKYISEWNDEITEWQDVIKPEHLNKYHVNPDMLEKIVEMIRKFDEYVNDKNNSKSSSSIPLSDKDDKTEPDILDYIDNPFDIGAGKDSADFSAISYLNPDGQLTGRDYSSDSNYNPFNQTMNISDQPQVAKPPISANTCSSNQPIEDIITPVMSYPSKDNAEKENIVDPSIQYQSTKSLDVQSQSVVGEIQSETYIPEEEFNFSQYVYKNGTDPVLVDFERNIDILPNDKLDIYLSINLESLIDDYSDCVVDIMSKKIADVQQSLQNNGFIDKSEVEVYITSTKKKISDLDNEIASLRDEERGNFFEIDTQRKLSEKLKEELINLKTKPIYGKTRKQIRQEIETLESSYNKSILRIEELQKENENKRSQIDEKNSRKNKFEIYIQKFEEKYETFNNNIYELQEKETILYNWLSEFKKFNSRTR